MESIATHVSNYEAHLILKNFSPLTIKMYLRTLKHFLQFRNDKGLTESINQEQAKEYILHRYALGRSWKTINCDYSSLRKYYRDVLEIEWSFKKLPRPRKQRDLPKILSQEDVIRLIENGATYKHQIFLTFIYATGLRLSEALNITFDDIDGNRLQIRVNCGKGSKDRIVQIPLCLLKLLRHYYRRCRPERYLFNGLEKGNTYSRRAAQRSIIRAKKRAGITKRATIHTLRHCYATHHIESGTDLVYLQEQLGHKHLKTTARYIQLCMERYRQINHPIAKMQIRYQ